MKPDNIFIFMLIMIGLCISAVIYLPHTGSGSRVEIRINGDASTRILIPPCRMP